MPQTLYSIGVYLICTLQSPLFLGIEVEGLTLYIGLHGVLFSLIMTLASLLQVKYQLAKESPFDTHNGFMLTFIVVTLVYAMALLLELILRAQNSTYCAILGNLNILAGALAAVLLLLILVPFVGWTIFAIWLAYSIKAACDLYRELCRLLYQSIRQVLLNVQLGRGFMQEQNRLPV
ncbi:hypothetical protein P3X46_003942 [Hevea brasiliensis]|uniref:MARVEL domain-containing protein n=1 Tax=Hevea brasiliensis TaxID=3981 RepID=A0ABQ9NAG9_HEVBR|nr:hypothetical protein P3X46_003942 [Hevea brasiliensis]